MVMIISKPFMALPLYRAGPGALLFTPFTVPGSKHIVDGAADTFGRVLASRLAGHGRGASGATIPGLSADHGPRNLVRQPALRTEAHAPAPPGWPGQSGRRWPSWASPTSLEGCPKDRHRSTGLG